MSVRRTLAVVLSVVAMVMLAGAQEPKKEVKHVPPQPTSAASGQEMFVAYCAVCHGKDAKGGGPAAASLKSTPPDLTSLAKNNNGKYPALKVMSVLRGEANVGAHGNREMPVWGPVFWHMSQGHESEMQQRIANLSRYIESLQAK